MYYLFFPIISIIVKFNWLVLYEETPDEEKREDLQSTFEQVDDEETMEKDQQEMIANVFDFSKTSVYKAMTPRDEMSCISASDSLEKAMLIFIESGHSKLPVYEGDLDNIIGMVYLYDFFKIRRITSKDSISQATSISNFQYRS